MIYCGLYVQTKRYECGMKAGPESIAIVTNSLLSLYNMQAIMYACYHECLFMYACVLVCMYACVHVCLCAYIDIRVPFRTEICVCARLQVCMCACVRM